MSPIIITPTIKSGEKTPEDNRNESVAKPKLIRALANRSLHLVVVQGTYTQW